MYGLGADSVTLDFSQGYAVAPGAPGSAETMPDSSATFDFSQGYAVLPGAPGSATNADPGFTVVTPNVAAPATKLNPVYVFGGIGVLFLLVAMGGRRR